MLVGPHGGRGLHHRRAEEGFPARRPCGGAASSVDVNLPGIDGYEVVAIIKSFPAFANTPVVALTAYAMEGDRQRTLVAGCDGYIQKPIDVDTFPRQVEEFLHGKREHVEEREEGVYLRELNQRLVYPRQPVEGQRLNQHSSAGPPSCRSPSRGAGHHLRVAPARCSSAPARAARRSHPQPVRRAAGYRVKWRLGEAPSGRAACCPHRPPRAGLDGGRLYAAADGAGPAPRRDDRAAGAAPRRQAARAAPTSSRTIRHRVENARSPRRGPARAEPQPSEAGHLLSSTLRLTDVLQLFTSWYARV